MGAEAIETGDIVQRTQFRIIGGSFFDSNTMEPLAAFFRISGHEAEVMRDLPTQDREARPEDHARALADQLRGLGSVILLAYSGGSSHVGRALEMLEEENGSHPVKLVVSISGSLELPPKNDDEAAPRHPRNTEQFRDGILPRDDELVEFDPDRAIDTFFNTELEIGALLASRMISQYRVTASPMPQRLNTRWLYLYPENDHVRNIRSVLETVEHYRDGQFRMDLRVVEGKDHALPITDPASVWHTVLDYCLRHEVEIIPPIGARTQGALPSQRQASHDLTSGPVAQRQRLEPRP